MTGSYTTLPKHDAREMPDVLYTIMTVVNCAGCTNGCAAAQRQRRRKASGSKIIVTSGQTQTRSPGPPGPATPPVRWM
jgi:hypothetical protein